MQPFGRTAKVLFLGHRNEVTHLTHFHVVHPPVSGHECAPQPRLGRKDYLWEISFIDQLRSSTSQWDTRIERPSAAGGETVQACGEDLPIRHGGSIETFFL